VSKARSFLDGRERDLLLHLPDGVAILDAKNAIQWANPRLVDWCTGPDVEGRDFYTAIGGPQVLGGDPCPFQEALACGRMTSATLRVGDNRYLHVNAEPTALDGIPYVLATVRDVTEEILEQQKRAAIHRAGQTLADLAPDELADMSVEERIELLKSNILHYSKDLLKFDVVEIRLLDQQTGRLEPLLAEGMEPEAQSRVLYALPENNGVTGYDGQELPLHRHHEGSSLPRGLQGGEELAHRAACSPRRGDRNLQRREPVQPRFSAGRIHRHRLAVPRDLLP
jgi:hypothetical protein